ncbi:hypothetical protein PJL18_02935 [Paenarthrobacter nicotinovorans]|nr:hypothetical protein [Paenarthrobacter nicotinovorans]
MGTGQLDPADRRKLVDDPLHIPRVRGDAGADRCGAQAAFAQQGGCFAKAALVFLERDSKGSEFLPERHGHRVLQLRPSDFGDVRERVAAFGERFGQQGQLFQQVFECEHEGQAHGCRVDVVGGLAFVDVPDRVDHFVGPPGVTQGLQGQVGDDLVGVHVRRGSCPALDDVHGERIVDLAGGYCVAGRGDRQANIVRDQAQLGVGQGRGLLHNREGADEVTVGSELDAADGEIEDRPFGVDAPEGGCRNGQGAQAVPFDPDPGFMSCAGAHEAIAMTLGCVISS